MAGIGTEDCVGEVDAAGAEGRLDKSLDLVGVILLLRAGTGVGSLGFGTLAQFQSTLRGVRFAHGPRRRSARSGSVL